MKMPERIERKMQADKPMILNLAATAGVRPRGFEGGCAAAWGLGVPGVEPGLHRDWLRTRVAEREAQRAKDSTVEEFSQRLMARGVPEKAIQEAVAEMRAGR